MPTKAEKMKEERTTHKKSVHAPKQDVKRKNPTRLNVRKSPMLPALPGGRAREVI
jgi:hypothetical protein